MGSYKLTDEDLIELAKEGLQEDYEDRGDVKYYQESFLIMDGSNKIALEHLYHHYKRWSFDPLSIEVFLDFLKLQRKQKSICYIDKSVCNIDFLELIGDYVRKKREDQKEKRFRQVPGFKPKT